MATQHYQEQEQDDLMAAFDAPIKEVGRSTLRRRRSSKNERCNFDRDSRKEVNKHTVKTNLHQETDLPMSSKKSYNSNTRNKSAVETRGDVKERNLGSSGGKVMHNVGHTQASEKDRLPEAPECWFESFNVLLEEIQKIITANARVLRNFESANVVVEKFVKRLDIVYEVPKYQEELKYISALALVCYGGSWTMLAGIIAAVEVFETEEVIEEALKIGNYIVFEEYDTEYEVSPQEIKEAFRNLALHFALMVAVVICPAIAEICISIAFASKFSPLVSSEELLKKIMISLDVANMNIDDYFGILDPEWFGLLSLLCCNIVSVILFGCFPRLLTAMFMGYFGFSLLAEAFQNGIGNFIPFTTYSVAFEESFWVQKTTQYYIWAFIAVMALWQAMDGYSGSFEFVSWFMFLYPAVRLYNILVRDPKCPEDERL